MLFKLPTRLRSYHKKWIAKKRQNKQCFSCSNEAIKFNHCLDCRLKRAKERAK